MNVYRALDILDYTLGNCACEECEVRYNCMLLKEKKNVDFCSVHEIMNTFITLEEKNRLENKKIK